MELQFNLYLALAINGFFTGLGTITAIHFYKYFLKKRLIKLEKKVKRIVKKNETSTNER